MCNVIHLRHPDAKRSRAFLCGTPSKKVLLVEGDSDELVVQRAYMDANGGRLPMVVIPFDGQKPLAGKLFTLLSKGEKKGGLGVKRTGGDDHPQCCDIPSSATYTIADRDASLSCTMRSGGFAAIQRAECVFSKNDTH